MSDAGRDLGELKREVVESRNQAIKTDNQIKNLTLDIKGFEKRFDSLEGRVRMAGIGVNLIVAVTIAAAGYMVSTMRSKSFEGEIANLHTLLSDEKAHAQAQGDAQQKKMGEAEKKRRAHEHASDSAMQILGLLDNHQDKEAGDLLDKLAFDDLGALERKSLERRFGELRQRQAETSYRSGRAALFASNVPQGISDLRRALALDASGRFAGQARYQLALALYNTKRYDEAEPVFRDLIKSDDRRIVEEAQYYLAASLAHLDKRDEAKTMMTRILAGEGKFAPPAKAYAQALETGGELPVDLPGGRVRLMRKAPPEQQDAQPAAPAQAAPVAAPAPAPR